MRWDAFAARGVLRVLKSFVALAADVLLATAVRLEGVMASSMTFPGEPVLVAPLRCAYSWSDRQVIRTMPACTECDDRAMYRLPSGTCRSRNREFSNAYRVNLVGPCDDKELLVAVREEWAASRLPGFAVLQLADDDAATRLPGAYRVLDDPRTAAGHPAMESALDEAPREDGKRRRDVVGRR